MNLKWFLPLSLLLLSFSFLWWFTLGFSAFTVFSYTLKKAGTPPYPVPSIKLICHNGKVVSLHNFEKRDIYVNFIYLSCYYGCPISLTKMFYLIKNSNSGDIFISVSVDPERDTIPKLKERWHLLGGFNHWLFCKPLEKNWKPKFLKMGVWVYRRKDGLINHTLEIFRIRNKKVVEVIPVTATTEVSGS